MEHMLWTEKYRPKKVDECILPKRLKVRFQEYIKDGDVPNLLLTGGPGVGKTTVAKAMLNEMGISYYFLNGSLDGGKDNLRTEILSYASTMSLDGGRKFVIIDEADHMTHHFQPALRAFMEEFSSNCGFILTCNYPSRIIKELHSRVATIPFDITRKDEKVLGLEFFQHVQEILELEGVGYEKKTIALIINKFFPDFRRVLNTLQDYSKASGGHIDSGVLSAGTLIDLNHLTNLMKEKKFTELSGWVLQNLDIVECSTLIRRLFDGRNDYLPKDQHAPLVMILSEYQYKDAFVADKQLNVIAMLTEIMLRLTFK